MRALPLLLLPLLLLAAPAAEAATLRTFHVATTGNDTAAGTSALPWRTLQRAANAARAGDLIVVHPGRYAGFNLTASGTPADPIVFSAQPGVVVDTPNPVRPQDGINLEGASWVVIEGFTVTGMPRTGIRSVLNHHVTIRRNVGDANGRWGILTGFSDDLLIEDNVMSRSVAEHGIYVSNSGDRPVIRRNHVWGNFANGIHMNGDLGQGGDGVISGAVVEGNVIHGNGRGGGSGINGDGVQASRIVNNILYDNHASGISLYRIDGGQPARNNLVAHNTIVQAADARWAINIQNASTGNRVVNNILLTAHTFRGAISISADSLSGFASDSNAVTPRFTLDGGSSVLDLDDWQRTTGRDTHSFAAAPAALFLNAAAANYNLRADSPARDTAVAATDVATDYDGRPRPLGPLPDIGADEFGEPAGSPDLLVTALSSPPASVRRGGRFVVTDTVVNGGGAAAGATVTRYFLSVDGARGPGDRMLEARRPVPALVPDATSSGSAAVIVPAATPRGAYVLLACADAAAAIPETSETNNCRAAATAVVVR
jgi:hypothetical protein